MCGGHCNGLGSSWAKDQRIEASELRRKPEDQKAPASVTRVCECEDGAFGDGVVRSGMKSGRACKKCRRDEGGEILSLESFLSGRFG